MPGGMPNMDSGMFSKKEDDLQEPCVEEID